MPVKEKRRLEVLLETHEITKVSFKRNDSATFFCSACQTETLHLTISEVILIFNLSEIGVLQFVAARQAHLVETAEGPLLVCGNSLAVSKGRIHEK